MDSTENKPPEDSILFNLHILHLHEFFKQIEYLYTLAYYARALLNRFFYNLSDFTSLFL